MLVNLDTHVIIGDVHVDLVVYTHYMNLEELSDYNDKIITIQTKKEIASRRVS